MNRIGVLLGTLLCLLTFGISGGAQAQADESGLDVRVGLSAGVMDLGIQDFGGLEGVDGTKNNVYAGLSANLTFGYRWMYVGFYLNMDLGGLFYNVYEDLDEEYESAAEKEWRENRDAGAFIGSTLLELHGFLPYSSNFQLEGVFGLGVIYSENNTKLKPDDDRFGRITIITPEMGDEEDEEDDAGHSAAFALKFGIAATYYVSPNLGFGLHFDYVLGIKNYEYGDEDYKILYHHFMPGIHARLRF